jgi:hypothetical protein
MNEKLAAWQGRMSDRVVGKGHQFGGRKSSNALVFFRKNTEKSGSRSLAKRDVLKVSFNHRILALTGWKFGDIIDMEISDELAVIFRSEKGVTLCSSDSKLQQHIKQKSNARPYLRFSFPEGALIDLPIGDCREVETKPGQIAFLIPKKGE